MLLLYPRWLPLTAQRLSLGWAWLVFSSALSWRVSGQGTVVDILASRQSVSLGGYSVCVGGEGGARGRSLIQLFILQCNSAGLAGIRRACTTFFLLLRQCPGRWTACRGQWRVWVPLAVSVWSPSSPHHWGQRPRTTWVQHGTLKRRDCFFCCWNFSVRSKLTTLPFNSVIKLQSALLLPQLLLLCRTFISRRVEMINCTADQQKIHKWPFQSLKTNF